MTDQAHLPTEEAQEGLTNHHGLAIGAVISVLVNLALALALVVFYLLWQRDVSRGLSEARNEAERAREVAEVAAKQSQQASQDVAAMAEVARQSLPIIAIGLHSSISRQGWVVEDGKPTHRITQGVATFAKYGPDGTGFVIAEDNKVYMGNSDTLSVTEHSVEGPVLSAAYLSDGHRLIVTDDAGGVTILESFTGRAANTIKTSQSNIIRANLSNDGHLLVTAGQDRRIYLWRLPGAVFLKDLGVNNDVLSLAFSNDNSKLLVGLTNGVMYQIEIANGRIEGIYSGLG